MKVSSIDNPLSRLYILEECTTRCSSIAELHISSILNKLYVALSEINDMIFFWGGGSYGFSYSILNGKMSTYMTH